MEERLKIAVCDDVKEDREGLKRDLSEIWAEAEIVTFADGAEVLGHFQRGDFFDLVFLDIIMGEKDGIEVGRKLRRFAPDIAIVYVSCSREFGPEAFENNALHYLTKPYQTEGLREVEKRFSEKRKAVVHLEKGNQEIPLHMIGYIESAHNNLEIHLITGKVLTVRSSLWKFMDNLDERFLRINRGVVVNMEAVDKMNTMSCELMGMTFMLGRKDRAENRKRYREWLFQTALEGGSGV